MIFRWWKNRFGVGSAARGEYQVQYRMRRKNGTYLWVYDKGALSPPRTVAPPMISIIMDISTSIELQKRLTKEATVDALTHLLNRREAVRRLEMDDGKGALMLIDIDDFKQLNDHLGHQVGDSVLVELGKILKENVRENDVAARFGGDEFLVYLSHTVRSPLRGTRRNCSASCLPDQPTVWQAGPDAEHRRCLQQRKNAFRNVVRAGRPRHVHSQAQRKRAAVHVDVIK